MEDNIHEAVTESVSHIRRQERQLVAALHAICADSVDDETRAERKKALSEYVRKLEDACDAADKLLNVISEGSGPAAFLLQHRRSVDAMMSLMTSQTTSVTDWPTYKRHVRFEAHGLHSTHGLRVGRIVIDEQDSDVEDAERDDVSSAQQHIHTYSAVTVPDIDDDIEWIEVKLSDTSVQTDGLDQSSPSSRCQASGSVPASTLRLSASHDQHVMTGASPTSTRRRPPSPLPPAAAASSSSSSSSSTTSSTGTLNDYATSLRDASTSTAANAVSWSTITDRLDSDSDLSSVICHDQQTSTESLCVVHDRATNTQQLQMCSLGVTAAPLTTNKSTSTDNSTDVHILSHVSLDADDKTIDADEDLTTTTSCSPCSASTFSSDAASHSSVSTTGDGDSFVFVESPVTSASIFCVPPLSSAVAGSVDLTAGPAGVTSSLKTDDCDASTAVAPSVRLAALLPHIARTADILAASHFSSDLTARLLREIVDVGLQMTSSCRRHTQDATTNTSDQETNNERTRHVRGDVIDQGVGQSVVTTSDVSTMSKLMPTTFHKETSTVRAHQVNKNVATDSLSTVDKQTSMTIDVASAYIASAAAATRRVASVSRGTSTSSQSLVDRATSPVSVSMSTFTTSSPSLVDRATSPVSVTLVDKAVTASKAEALEPVDTFQAAGQLSGPLSPRSRRPLSLSPRSKLACISESAECYDEEETTEDLDDVSATIETSERLNICQTGSSQRSLMSTTSMMQQPEVGQLSANVFNFDHVVTSRLAQLSAACLRSTMLDDDRMSLSAVGDADDLPSSADQSCLSALVQDSRPADS